MSLSNLFNNYFSKRNCSNFIEIPNFYSRIDGILLSGNTIVLLEHKRRYNSIVDYYTAFLEKKKFDNLVLTSKLFNAPAFYCIEYDDIVLIYNIDSTSNYEWESMPSPVSSTDGTIISKDVAFLKYSDALHYVAKNQNYERRQYCDLEYYLKKKRNEQ